MPAKVVQPAVPSDRSSSSRRRRNPLDMRSVVDQVKSYINAKRQIAALNTTLPEYRDPVKALVERFGTEDEKGSRFLDLPETVEGVATVKAQRAVSDVFDEQAATKITKDRAIFKRCTKEIRVFDPDAIRGAFFEGLLTKEELDQIFKQKVSFSFVMLDENGRQVS